MPVVLRAGGFRFFFYANEGSPREPAHVHVDNPDAEAKFWLRPNVRLAFNDGFNSKTLRQLLELIEVHREEIERAWNDFFG